MRVLILSANTGGGHNSTAASIGEQLRKANIEYEIGDTLAFISEKVSEFVSWGHSYVYRKLPRLFGSAYKFEEKHPPRFIYDQCAKGAGALYEKLKSGNYDRVICVHVFAGMMMTELRARYGAKIPAYFVATDYTCSPGVSELKMDGYFIPHRMLLGEFVRNNLPADKLHATGIPIRSEFFEHGDKREARRELDLPEDKKVLLLGCGSMGCGKLERSALYLFKKLPESVCLVVLCGKNEKTYEMLKPYACDRLRILQYTEKMPLYMTAADLNITKPGGLTTTESIAKHLPMIFYNAVPGCETRNYNFLIRQGVAKGAKSWRRVASLVRDLLNDKSTFPDFEEALNAFSGIPAAEQIARYVQK